MVLSGIQVVNGDLDNIKGNIQNAESNYTVKLVSTLGTNAYSVGSQKFAEAYLIDVIGTNSTPTVYNNAGKVRYSSIPAYNENFYPLEVSYTLPGLNIKTTSNSININK